MTAGAAGAAGDMRTGAANETEAAILRGTGALLGDQALGDLSVAKILAAADVSRATFYSYFASKDDAFVALLRSVAEDVVARLERHVTTTELIGDRDAAARTIASWLRLDAAEQAVLRSAAVEWPRSADVRQVYLDGVDRLVVAVAGRIETDRASGAAPPGIDAALLASTLLWTIERTITGTVTQEARLQDGEAVTAFLGRLVVASVYGR